MIIAVTDACIFIDLIELQITSPFFRLKIEVHTTVDVWNELYEEQQKILTDHQTAGNLIVHVLSEDDMVVIGNQGYSNRLSLQDHTVIYLAEKLDAVLLSSDKVVRNYAKERAIEYHGMFWILDQLVANEILSKNSALSALRSLLENNLMYKNNVKLWKEAHKRFEEWKDNPSGDLVN